MRKISSGEGVERTFQTYSPLIACIEVKRRGDVRRAKLYYLRERSGKSARIKEKLAHHNKPAAGISRQYHAIRPPSPVLVAAFFIPAQRSQCPSIRRRRPAADPASRFDPRTRR